MIQPSSDPGSSSDGGTVAPVGSVSAGSPSSASTSGVSSGAIAAASAAEKRGDDEQPHVRKRCPALDERRTERARRVGRRPVERNADEVDDGQHQADRQPGKARCSRTTGDEQHHDDEQEGEDHFEDERAEHVDRDTPVVGTERASVVHDVTGRGHEFEQQRTDDGSDHLCDPVRTRFACAEMPPRSSTPSVTAGLTWQPDTGPIEYASASRTRPKVKATPAAPMVSIPKQPTQRRRKRGSPFLCPRQELRAKLDTRMPPRIGWDL